MDSNPPTQHASANEQHDSHADTARLNIRAVNAVSRAVGELRRTLGVRVAARAVPAIFAKAGIQIERAEPEQGELKLGQSDPTAN